MKSRIEVEAGINNCLLISDLYNSDLTSLTKHALGFLEQQLANQDMHRVLIVSDIEGNELVCDMFYKNLQDVCSSNSVDEIVLLGKELCAQNQRFKIAKKYCFAATDEFLNSEIINNFKNKAILLKIAPEFSTEKVQMFLQLLPHDTVLEINFDAMLHNINYFRSKIKPETKLMCMVKASAYGSGSVEVALAMQHYGCDYLGVAFANEGVELREAGVELPIMVLNPMATALYHLFKYRLEPEICNFKMLYAVANFAKKLGIKNYPVHIKIDTGMHRAGFEMPDIEQVINFINSQNNLKIASVFSHLAAADEDTAEMNNFTLQQISLFEKITATIEKSVSYKFLKHILNTAGIERFSKFQFDMVRLGIGLWGVENVKARKRESVNDVTPCYCGIDPQSELQNNFQFSIFNSPLKNVCSLSTKIIQIKNVSSRQSIGYGRKGRVEQDKKIALLPLGYADGINRKLSNGAGFMLINGKKAPIIGNICMDLLMLDVTGLDAKEGDKVVIFNAKRPFPEIAEQLGTIPYEVLTSISPRVRRVYFTENS
ncbi:MAG: alanine racemase [Prevotellaceae bacterium]|jgi:alanine racemase|nr:alanine racemase [Prevotellaceae bacterium]